MSFSSTGTRLSAYLLGVLTVMCIGTACESQEFEDAPRAVAPDEPLVDNDQRQRRGAARKKQSGSLPADHPPVAQDRKKKPSQPSPQPGGGSANLPVAWTAPDAWKRVKPSSSMRAAQYRLPGAEGEGPATLAIYHFGSRGGGSVQANIDRWVGQFESPEGGSVEGDAKRSKQTVDGLDVHIVDVSGTYSPGAGMGAGKARKNQRMLGAIAKSQGGLVFFKLIGPEQTVSEHREEFDSFVDSFHPAE